MITDGERMVWAAAFAQAQINGIEAPRASSLAYECVNGLRLVAYSHNERFEPQTVMARDVLDAFEEPPGKVT